MALTRPKLSQLDSSSSVFTDPLLVLHQGATAANIDVGFLFNRANGLVSNVALYWSETDKAFYTTYTNSGGATDANLIPTTYANLVTNNLTANSINTLTDVTITGNLTVNGSTTTLSATNSVVADSLMELNTGAGSNANDLGFIFERGSTGDNAAIIWDESADEFVLGTTTATGASTGDLTITNGSLRADMLRVREQRYTTSNMMKFNQLYTGAAIGSYFEQNEYQKIVTIVPSGDSQNYQVSGRILAQSAGAIQTINFIAALRSNTLPDLDWNITYTEEHNGTAHFKPQLWTKETTTAGFIFAIQKISSGSLYGTVTVDLDVIPRTSALLDNVTVNTTQNSEQTTVDTGYTANDMTLVRSQSGSNSSFSGDLIYSTLNDGTTDLTATVAELNYVDGVTSSIQTQLDGKLSGSALDTLDANVGTIVGTTIPTLDANLGTATTNITTLFANAASQASLLDVLSGNAVTQQSELAELVANAASQSSDLTTLLANAATQADELTVLTANAATQSGAIDSINANVGAFQTYANVNFSTIDDVIAYAIALG